jgi:prepilin-type N-terminal cleavage/methylation domain-containing protein
MRVWRPSGPRRFTLIELLIVLAILGILVGIVCMAVDAGPCGL